jgi:lysophospholipase L1-like esterase
VRRLLPLLFLALFPAPVPAAERFELRDGDRVALVGSTVIEREQRYGYWETALTSRYPDRNVTFRNLGWSGDTVWGEARIGFDLDRPQLGYQRLLDAVRAVKPTVIIVGYGTNESFAGEAGLSRFVAQLNKLLDDLAPTRARFVLLAPQIEDARWRAGNLDARKHDLALYAEAIRQVAESRQAVFIERLWKCPSPGAPLTDDGMHLSDYGYWATANTFLSGLQIPSKGWRTVELNGLAPKEVLQEVLPLPPPPSDAPREAAGVDSFLGVRGLVAGRYTLTIDGHSLSTADADSWLKPPRRPPMFGKVVVTHGPSLDQAEKLRRTIVEKNRLYFRRWRPENETYLFGFRKHEQGQNAREIPEFDPLVANLEKEIARLRKPVPHTYQLVPAGEDKK